MRLPKSLSLCKSQPVATLLRRAELAMSEAKRRHKNFVFVSDIGAEPLYEELSLIGEMREALGRQEFCVYYQPKLNLHSGKIDAAEVLIRWQHPERGLVPPVRFIPFAGQTGFIREITPWSLETVAAQTAQWRGEGLSTAPSVNLSALNLLTHDLADQVRCLIGLHRIPPQDFRLKITESALMEDPALALKHLEELASPGVKPSIDDYGTGQASLAYLKTLPVQELKIDQTFITSVADSPGNAAIVRSTIVLCHALGLKVVAEGAETASDIGWLATPPPYGFAAHRLFKRSPPRGVRACLHSRVTPGSARTIAGCEGSPPAAVLPPAPALHKGSRRCRRC